MHLRSYGCWVVSHGLRVETLPTLKVRRETLSPVAFRLFLETHSDPPTKLFALPFLLSMNMSNISHDDIYDTEARARVSPRGLECGSSACYIIALYIAMDRSLRSHKHL